MVGSFQIRGIRVKNDAIRPGKVQGLVQPEPVQTPIQTGATPELKPTVDPVTQAPLGAHTGSTLAPVVGQTGAAGAKLHTLDREPTERRTGKRTSALKTRPFDWYQRQLRKPAVRQHFKELAAQVRTSPALQLPKPANGVGET